MLTLKIGFMRKKRYPKLCTLNDYQFITGDYIYDVDRDVLYLNSKDNITNEGLIDNYIKFEVWGLGPFYTDLDISFARDHKIPLYLNKKGEFIRKDGIDGKSTIERLFSIFSDETKRDISLKNPILL